MSSEGANRYGAGWEVIHKALWDAQEDIVEEKGYLQGPLYQGLGWLAVNFAQHSEAELNAKAA